MKTITVLRNSLFLFPLLCLATYSIQGSEAPTGTSEKKHQNVRTETKKPKINLEYETPMEFMQAFLDVSQNKNKPLTWWALQMYLLCKQDTNLTPFSIQLIKVAKGGTKTEPITDRAGATSKLFLKYQADFAPELRAYIMNTVGLREVVASLAARAKK